MLTNPPLKRNTPRIKTSGRMIATLFASVVLTAGGLPAEDKPEVVANPKCIAYEIRKGHDEDAATPPFRTNTHLYCQ